MSFTPDGGSGEASDLGGVALPLIRLRGVTKNYGTGALEHPALRDVDLDIGLGEMVSIVGPSDRRAVESRQF